MNRAVVAAERRSLTEADIGAALEAMMMKEDDALQTYVRGLSLQSRYNRFLGAASELPASELARAFGRAKPLPSPMLRLA